MTKKIWTVLLAAGATDVYKRQAIKSGKIDMGKTYKTPCEDIVIRQCSMNDGHGSVVLGSEIGAGVRHLTVKDCIFNGTDRGLRIKTRRGRGEDCVAVSYTHLDHNGNVYINIMLHVRCPPLQEIKQRQCRKLQR